MASDIVSPLDDISSWIPEGYITVNGPNNQCYVVPDFFVPALHQSLDAQQEKCIFDFGKAAGTVSVYICSSFFQCLSFLNFKKSLYFNSLTFDGLIGEGKIMVPTSPVRFIFVASENIIYLHHHRVVVMPNASQHMRRY